MNPDQRTLDYAALSPNEGARRLRVINALLLGCAVCTTIMMLVGLSMMIMVFSYMMSPELTLPARIWFGYGLAWTTIALVEWTLIRRRKYFVLAKWLSLGLTVFVPIGTVIGLLVFFMISAPAARAEFQ